MRYTVNDMTAYGIYNGFSKFDAKLNDLLDKELSFLLENDLTGYFDVKREVLKVLNHDEQIKEAAMAYYVPNPTQDWWSAEYKAYHTAAALNKTAPGDCDIPDNIVVGWVHNAASQCLKSYVSGKIQSLRSFIEKAERQVDIPTPEVAKRRTLDWNRIQNEGGEGFIPHIINSVEYESAKSSLKVFESYKPSLQDQILMAANNHSESGISNEIKSRTLDSVR